MAPQKQPWRFCGILLQSLGENIEAVYEYRINDTFFVGLWITTYIHIGYLMKNRGLGWQLDMSSTDDNGKIKFFLNECSLLGDILEKMEIIVC